MSHNHRIHIPASPKTQELNDIKQRQRDRKLNGQPEEITVELLYSMLSDVLENQAKIENKLNTIIKNQ